MAINIPSNFFTCVLLISVFSLNNAQSINVNDLLFSGSIEYLDLTHPFDNHTTYWPGNRKFAFTKKFAGKNTNGIWYSANEFCAAEHGGTHIDAPNHFGSDLWTVGEIPFENLITPVLVIDLSSLVAGDPDFVLQKHHMDNLFHLDPRRNHTVIFRFGWSQYYGNDAKYLGTDRPTKDNLRFPGISLEVAKWITETSRNLVGVGVDTPSVDAGSDQSYAAHRTFSARNIFILENIKIDRTLPSNQCAIMVMPMKIQDGTGAPARLTAICPRIHAHNLF